MRVFSFLLCSAVLSFCFVVWVFVRQLFRGWILLQVGFCGLVYFSSEFGFCLRFEIVFVVSFLFCGFVGVFVLGFGVVCLCLLCFASFVVVGLGCMVACLGFGSAQFGFAAFLFWVLSDLFCFWAMCFTGFRGAWFAVFGLHVVRLWYCRFRGFGLWVVTFGCVSC